MIFLHIVDLRHSKHLIALPVSPCDYPHEGTMIHPLLLLVAFRADKKSLDDHCVSAPWMIIAETLYYLAKLELRFWFEQIEKHVFTPLLIETCGSTSVYSCTFREAVQELMAG